MLLEQKSKQRERSNVTRTQRERNNVTRTEEYTIFPSKTLIKNQNG
jgi:hypothetical protein